ncbi:MAG TPA: hypothetical protein PLM14_07115 [Candidatus Hydrogenedentes bacterium]|nr:hypothetical protein [Candidatus Hydrogenedentota bacterium]HQE82756.1 hypothetical protein [Candidatus Hydrogenedentota bacterium]HQH54320.1 hypothetical protein [Candidatus Hydrogenedentota bacterium]
MLTNRNVEVLNRFWAAIGAMFAVVCLFAGCASTRGPDLVVNSHLAYNRAVNQVVSEELLLNIVRRRYLEAPQFLTVSSISANFEISRNLEAGGTYDFHGNGASTQPSYSYTPGSGFTIAGTRVDSSAWSPLSLNAGVAFSDSPTITFTPRQGEDIAGRLHASMDSAVLANMANAGYCFDLLLLLLVQDINGV